MFLLQKYFMQGFAPADKVLLFRRKCPKPFLPVHGPPGAFLPLPNQDGSETRGVYPEPCRRTQTVFAKGSNSVRGLRYTQYGGKGSFEILNFTKLSTKDLTPYLSDPLSIRSYRAFFLCTKSS